VDARLPISPLLISQVISAPYRARIWSSRRSTHRPVAVVIHCSLGRKRYAEDIVMQWGVATGHRAMTEKRESQRQRQYAH
jgi:hypothetical protein